jgi:glutamate synthase (ferredoxin)
MLEHPPLSPVLIGYGASAVCPYLALESVRHWWQDSRTQKLMESGKLPVSTLNGAQDNYRKAVEAGLLKILSKMGISLITSYRGAQIFEAIGIGPDLLDLAFPGHNLSAGWAVPDRPGPGNDQLPPAGFPGADLKAAAAYGLCAVSPQRGIPHEQPRHDQAAAQGAGRAAVRPLRGLQETTARKSASVTALRDLLDFRVTESPISM